MNLRFHDRFSSPSKHGHDPVWFRGGRIVVGAFFMMCAACFPVRAAVASDVPPGSSSPVDRFLTQIRSDSSIPRDAASLIESAWAKCDGCDAAEFLTQGLAVLSSGLRDVFDAYDADEFETCARKAAQLREHGNPFVSVYAAAYEIKALTAQEKLLEAGQRIESLLSIAGRLRDHSYFAAEMEFLRGYCQLADLQYDRAAESLNRFLSDHPYASARLTIAARQILTELASRQPERIGEVVDLMQFSRRRLSNGDCGPPVQERQDRVIALLDRLIKEAEDQEKSSSSSSSGGSGSNNPGGSAARNPMDQSQLPGGSPSLGELREVRTANPAEAWGAMPPMERERILQALRESFPARYRQLVEQYYEELARKP